MTEPATHVIVDEEGVMLDVVTGVSPPYVVLLATHGTVGPGAVFGLDAAAARRLAQRLTDAANTHEPDMIDVTTFRDAEPVRIPGRCKACRHPWPCPCAPRATHPEGGLVPLGESGVSKSPDGTR